MVCVTRFALILLFFFFLLNTYFSSLFQLRWSTRARRSSFMVAVYPAIMFWTSSISTGEIMKPTAWDQNTCWTTNRHLWRSAVYFYSRAQRELLQRVHRQRQHRLTTAKMYCGYSCTFAMEDNLAAAKVPVWWRKKLAAPNSRLETSVLQWRAILLLQCSFCRCRSAPVPTAATVTAMQLCKRWWCNGWTSCWMSPWIRFHRADLEDV